MNKTKKLIIVGAGEFGEIAYEYFTDDSCYDVVAFAVEKEFIKQRELRGIPVIEFEKMESAYSPEDYEVFVAVTFVKLNRVRRRLYNLCKEKGYHCASYISSHTFFWKNASIGENTFIFEDNTIQYNVRIGNNVVLWSGNHIGHRSVIEDDVWITSHVVVSGFCHIGKGCFIGVNATFGDNITIAEDVVVGAGSVTVKNLEKSGGIYIGSPAKMMSGKSAYDQFDLKEI